MRRQTTPTPKPATKVTSQKSVAPKLIDRAGLNARAAQAAVDKFKADPATKSLPKAEYQRRYLAATQAEDTSLKSLPTPKPINPNVKYTPLPKPKSPGSKKK